VNSRNCYHEPGQLRLDFMCHVCAVSILGYFSKPSITVLCCRPRWFQLTRCKHYYTLSQLYVADNWCHTWRLHLVLPAGSDRVNGMMPDSGTSRSIFDVSASEVPEVVWVCEFMVNVTRLLTSSALGCDPFIKLSFSCQQQICHSLISSSSSAAAPTTATTTTTAPPPSITTTITLSVFT